MITVDIETIDPNLHDIGDGSIRKDGRIICVGTYDGHNAKCYWDPRDPELIERMASNEDKCFHNGIYDLAWMCCGYDIKVNGKIHDTMTRMSMIDEYAPLDLDSCCKRFNVPGKNKGETIEAWFDEHKALLGLKGNIWQNAEYVIADKTGHDMMENYNIQDCIATYNLWYAQEPYMRPYEDTYDMECRLYPLLIKMKKCGVRIDENALEALLQEVSHDRDEVITRMGALWELTPEIIASPKKLGIAMHNLGLESPLRTPKGNESWNAAALERINHPAINDILEFKAKDALINKYLAGSMARCIYNGRIHCTFSPNKREDGGTITGRFACAKPNLQNISARDEKHGQKTYGTEMRKLFIPEEGQWMGAFDYSQIEYVLLAHFAQGPQAAWIKDQARQYVDFHTMAMQMTGLKERFPVKCINYGITYGMGLDTLKRQNYIAFSKLAEQNGMTFDEYVDGIYYTYLKKLPVVKDTMHWVEETTRMQGYVEGIGGRRHHKPKPTFVNGRINDGIYKMTNYLFQGSAAEIIKRAMLNAWDDGVFDVLTMHIQVHDELVVSIPQSKEGVEAAVHMEECMNNSYKDRLSVPIKAVGGVGDDWGAKHAEEDWQQIREQYGFLRSA